MPPFQLVHFPKGHLYTVARGKDWLAQQGSPLGPMTHPLLERWLSLAPDWHIGGNPGALGSEKI